MGRNITLTDQGTLVFKEGTGGGTDGVTIQAPATLAAAYTLTLPVDDGDANEFLQTNGSGVLAWATSASTLQSAYDGGGKITTAGAVPVEIEVGAASGNVGLLIDQDDDFKALDITKDGIGAGDAIAVLNSGTGRGMFIDQDGAAVGLSIDQATANFGLEVVGGGASAIRATQANDVSVMSLVKTGLGVGAAFFLENDGTGVGIQLQQDGAGRGLLIDQNGAGVALDVDQDGAAIGIKVNQATANDAVEITQAADGVALDIIKTGVGAGDTVVIENDGTGNALKIQQDGIGVGLLIDQNANSNALRIDRNNGGTPTIDINHTSTTGIVFDIDSSSAQAALDINCTGTLTSPAFTITAGSGTLSSVITVRQNGASTGIFINQDGNGVAFDIDSEATSNPLIELNPVTGNTRGDIAFGTARTADPGSPSEGDLWYDGTLERFKIKLSASTSKTIQSLYGPSWGIRTAHTISGGVVSVTLGVNTLAAESGVTDDVDTISGAAPRTVQAGDTIVVLADTGDTITLKHNTGNLHLDGSADKALVNGNQLMLLYDGTDWQQITPMMVLP
jgi:hypothetical protein